MFCKNILLGSLGGSNSQVNGHADHGVVTGAQETHRIKTLCCAFLPWEYLITLCVYETRCFDLIRHL